MKRNFNQERNILQIIGCNEIHQPFVCQINCKTRMVKYISRIKNGAEKIIHFFYKRRKAAFKNIKLYVLHSNKKSVIEQNIFIPTQLLKGNNQIHPRLLQLLKNNKFDSYISLNLKRIKNSQANTFNFTQILKEKQFTSHQTNLINLNRNNSKNLNDFNSKNLNDFNLTNTKSQNQINIKSRNQKNTMQNSSININNNVGIDKVQFQSTNQSNKLYKKQEQYVYSRKKQINYLKDKNHITNCSFFTQNRINQISQNHNQMNSQNKRNLFVENGKIKIFKQGNIQDNLCRLKITYTYIQKSNQSTKGQQKSKNLQCSRVSQTFSSKQIKKQKCELKGQTLIISDYLTPKVNKRSCDD